MEKKIIFIISSLDRGGAENSLFKLVKSLGYPSLIITLKKGGYYKKFLRKMKIEILEVDNKSISNFIKSLTNIFKKLSNCKIRLLHCWMYKSCLIGFLISIIFNVKNVYWSIRHSDTSNEKGRNYNKYFIIRICSLLSKIRKITIIYNSNKAKIEHQKIGFKKSKSSVIYNGYDHLKYKIKYGEDKILRKKFSLDENKFIISMFARFHPIKDHLLLFEGFHLLFQEFKNVHLFLAGYRINKENKNLTRLISKFELNDHVTLGGYLDEAELIDAYNMTDITVLTSRSESFPNVIPESMLCGTPCLATNVGDCKEIIGKYGWIIDSHSPLILKNKILDIIHEKNSSLNNWGKRKLINRESIIERFGINASCEKYKDLY